MILTSAFTYVNADQVAISEFGYLNSNDNSTVIDNKEASDLLNIDVSPSGKSVKKRPGFGLYKTVFSPSTGIHGGHHFFDSTGNDVQIWGSSTSVKTVVADGTPITIVSSMTVNSTLDCTDTQGSAYCVNSSRDFYIRTNGTTLTNWYTSPLGTMVESTPDRVVVAGVAASPNTLFVSQSNTFTNFTTGVNSTDAFNEVIAAPGSRITHIRWGCQKLLWWKDQSFGYLDFEDQYTAQVKIVSDNTGSVDNTSAIDPGGNVWFRGQDGHTYRYDCSGLEKMTVDITPQIQSSGRRTTNSWTQSTQSEFQAGGIVPTGQLSTTISAGDVVTSSLSVTENSPTSGWSSGTSNNFAIGTSSISLLTNNSGDVTDNGFETNPISTFWTISSGGGVASDTSDSFNTCTFAPDTGSRYGLMASTSGIALVANLIDANTLLAISTTSVNANGLGDCTWTTRTLSSSGNIGKRFYLKFTRGQKTAITKDSYILGGDITYKTVSDRISSVCPGGVCTYAFGIDTILLGSSTITSGSFTSQLYDLGFSSAIYQITDLTHTVNTSTPAFSIITAASPSGPWTQILTSSGTNAWGNRYSKFVSTISVSSTDSALTKISNISIVARSTGTLYSAWKNAPNFTAWGTFNPTFSNGDGTHTFYVRASTSPQSVLNSTITWVSQPANAQVATSTVGVYFQIRDDFAVTAATNNPVLNDFTVNWFEGSAGDQAYMLYFDNAIWETVAYGTGISTNNYVFRYDLINNGWSLYYFGAGGFQIQNNRLFFGDVNSGNVYQFGSGASDNGTAINAYWRSKAFTGSDPFLQNALSNIDVFGKKDTGSTLTSTYTLDTSSATSYSIVLSTSNQIVQSRKLLPSGKLGYTFDIKLGDQSTSSQWEVFGIRIGYNQQPYRSTP